MYSLGGMLSTQMQEGLYRVYINQSDLQVWGIFYP